MGRGEGLGQVAALTQHDAVLEPRATFGCTLGAEGRTEKLNKTIHL